MRWRIPAVVVLAAFLASSCDQTVPTAAEDSVSDVPTMKVVENSWYVDTWDFEHCDEWVDAVIKFKWLETYTQAASGNYNYQWKFNVHGQGVGRDTGFEYVWNNTFDWEPHQHGTPTGYPYSEHLVDNWVIIGKGHAPNFRAKVTYQLTTNANGDVTVDLVNYHESCE